MRPEFVGQDGCRSHTMISVQQALLCAALVPWTRKWPSSCMQCLQNLAERLSYSLRPGNLRLRQHPGGRSQVTFPRAFCKGTAVDFPSRSMITLGGNSRSRSRSPACLVKSQSHSVAGMLLTASRAFSCCPCIFLCPRGRIG